MSGACTLEMKPPSAVWNWPSVDSVSTAWSPVPSVSTSFHHCSVVCGERPKKLVRSTISNPGSGLGSPWNEATEVPDAWSAP